MAIKILTIPEMGFASNCYIVYSEESKKGLIVDPGCPMDEIVSELESNNIDLEKIVLTHGHSDHITSAEELREKYSIPILIHEDDEDMINTKELNFSTQMSPKPIEFSSDIKLKDGDEIEVNGEFKCDVMHTPGHTPGGICLNFGNIVITGDTIFQRSIGRTDFPGGNYDDIINSIKSKILVLKPETILLTGHGYPTTVEEETNFNPFLR